MVHLFALTAVAAPTVHLTATVDDDLQTVHGTLVLPDGVQLAAPLPLPLPDDDLTLVRTFPGAVDQGSQSFAPTETPHVWRFTTHLPRRYGAVGSTRSGVYALGGFHPQPLVDGEVVPIRWVVDITLPDRRAGVVGLTLGSGTLHWEGIAERVPLALPRRTKTWSSRDGKVVVLGKGRPRRVLLDQLDRVLGSVDLDHPLVVVEAPLRRRLTRHAPGVLFVSDRIFQLSFPFVPYQRAALVEGLEAADTWQSHPQLRDLVGRARAEAWERQNTRLGAARLTRALSFVPSIDRLLSSRRMAFYSETFRGWTPSDPLRDDVVEQVDRYRPGASVVAQLELRSDPETVARVARALDRGLDLFQALQLVGLDPSLAPVLTAPVPEQDYRLSDGPPFTLTREAAGGPPEMVEVAVDRERRVLELHPGEQVDLGAPGRIVLDPERRLEQTSRAGDAHPLERLRVVTAAGFTTLNLTRFRLEGSAAAWVRGRNDTHNLFYGSLSTSRTSTVAMRLTHIYKFGPLRYGITRRHRLATSFGPSLLNPSFQSVDDGRFALSGSLSWSWTNRDAAEFPLRGTSLSVGLSGGFHPDSTSRWGSVSAAVSDVRSFHPRHALAWSSSIGVARASRYDRLLTLGGAGRMASLPVIASCTASGEDDCADRALERWVTAAEYRFVAIRGARVPLLLAWGRELHLSAGVESMVAGLQEGPARALGATAGISGVYDLFGADPGLVGVTTGWLLAADRLDYAPVRPVVPEVFLRWTQSL